MIKFVNYDITMRDYAIPQFEQYLESWDTELQQRAIEYIILSKLDNEDKDIPNMSEIRKQLFESMPVYSTEFFNNSLLMRKLQQTQTGKYTSTKEAVETKPQTTTNEHKAITNTNDTINTVVENPYMETELYIKDPNGFAQHMNKNPQYAVLIDKNNISNFDMFKSLLTSNNNSSASGNGGIISSNTNSIKINLMINIKLLYNV